MNKHKARLILVAGTLALVLFACIPRGGTAPGSKPGNTPSAGVTSTAVPTPDVEDTQTPESQPQNTLETTKWVLVSMGKPGAETPVIEGTNVTLEFDENGRAGGSAGCNSFGARFQVQDGKISFSEIESTAMACEDEKIMEQEQRYLQTLQSTGKFDLSGGQLNIWSKDGQAVLQFNQALAETPGATPATGNSLANTQWALESFGSASTVESVISGTTVTLQFDGQGRASGSGGCNSFGAEFTLQGSSLSFGPVTSTKMACMEEGVGAQEQRYFEALQSAERFELSGGRLVIYYGDEQGTLTLVREGVSP